MNKLNDKPMRILERVQPFLDISYIEIFFHFPPNYIVCKLSYSQGALMKKCCYYVDDVLKLIQSKLTFYQKGILLNDY